jgi:hypothetical protein
MTGVSRMAMTWVTWVTGVPVARMAVGAVAVAGFAVGGGKGRQAEREN